MSRQENIEELVNGMHDFCDGRQEAGNPHVLLSDYLSEIALLTDQDEEQGEAQPKVTLMTIHSAKGLEFPNVFVVGLEENLFPKSQFAMVKEIVKNIKKAYEQSGTNSYVVMTTHSPYVLTSLNVLMKVALAKEKKLDEKMKEMLEYAIPISWYSAYCMTDEVKMENIVDDEYHFIMGDYLDSLSDEISELSSELDEMIYGNE